MSLASNVSILGFQKFMIEHIIDIRVAPYSKKKQQKKQKQQKKL